MSNELSLSYIELDKSESSSKKIKNYFEKMCNCFIPPLNEMVDINKYANKLTYNADCFFIQNYGEDVGFLAIYTNDYSKRVAFISSISVIPEYQGTGISQKLINFSIEHSRKKAMKYIKLEVNKNNIKAMKLYRKNGFNIESNCNNSLLMVKNM
ncbi:acetyltransferase, GNAT family [Methanosarcina sp. Kolksee]|uniref:GNAT family N-acetyltransferase n=1 Tax=Methanosarcina sp. Kolksee TaxID=1434099 RepID=UPI0006155958|nr:GNAT family N-acetyltransferase [Methanosarcina sp. Kolksee]AKB46570.1 acetyltransferase, GNAT family [Methanosarcina sp. Kolksee]